MDKTFHPWEVDQTWLFPPSVKEFVPEDHLAHFIREVVRQDLDLSALLSTYQESRGQPPSRSDAATAAGGDRASFPSAL
jgi:hypothetical protein